MITGTDFVVIGAGGHAKVVIATIEAAGGQVVRVLDDNAAVHGRLLSGHLVEGPVTEKLIPDGVGVVIALGSNRVRRDIASRLRARFAAVVHPSAVIHPSVGIGPGAMIFAGVVIQPDTKIGAHVIVNTGASIDHDCLVGDYAHVAPGARLAGGVHLGEGAFMGIASCAIPGARIGPWATVGAGGVVLADIPANAVAAGVPARVIKERG